jgi:phosphatidylinositol alpha 1,6-mannosyltransferase
MRILHVSDTFQPLLGGIEVLVDDLSTHQRHAGHQVRVLTSTPSPAPDDAATVRVSRPLLSPVDDLVRSFRPDAVHCHSSIVSPLAWRTARAAARSGLPVVVTMHSMVPRGGPVAHSLRSLARAMPAAVTWTAVSTSAAAALQPVVGRPVTVLPNGLDQDSCRPARAGTNPVPLIVSVMRLARRKRPLELVEILAQVKAQLGERPWRVAIVGDGPLKSAVQRAIRRHGLSDRVHLTGRLERPQIMQLLARADLYLAPAYLESFGIAALEARCSALPVVAMSSGGVGEFVRTGTHGYLVRDDTEMAYRAAYLVANRAALQAMGRRSLADPPDLTWASIVERTLQAYAVAGVAAPARALTPAGVLIGSA